MKQVAWCESKVTEADCVAPDIQVKNQTTQMSGRKNTENPLRTFSRKKKVTTDRVLNPALATRHGKFGRIAMQAASFGNLSTLLERRKETLEEKQEKEKQEHPWMVDVCTNVIANDEVRMSTNKEVEEMRGMAPPNLPAVSGACTPVYNPDMVIMGDPLRTITPIMKGRLMIGLREPSGVMCSFEDEKTRHIRLETEKDGKEFMIKKKIIEELELMVEENKEKLKMAGELSEAMMKKKADKKKNIVEKMENLIKKTRKMFDDKTLGEVECAKQHVKYNTEYVRLETKLRELCETNDDILTKGEIEYMLKTFNEKLEYTMKNPEPSNFAPFARRKILTKYPDLACYFKEFDAMVNKRRGRNVFFGHKVSGVGRERAFYAARMKIKELQEKADALRTEAAQLRIKIIELTTPQTYTTKGETEQQINTLRIAARAKEKAANTPEDTIKVLKAVIASGTIVKNPKMTELPISIRTFLCSAANNIGEDSTLEKQTRPSVVHDMGIKTDDLTRQNFNNMIAQKQCYVSDKAGARARKLLVEPMDPVFDPFVIRPIHPFFIGGREINTKKPYDRVRTYMETLFNSKKVDAAKIMDDMTIDDVLPEWLTKPFFDVRMDYLIHGPDFRYTWYPIKMESEEHMKKHTYYCTVVNRVYHLDMLMNSGKLPVGICRDLMLMQEMYHALQIFMESTGMYSDEELDLPATFKKRRGNVSKWLNINKTTKEKTPNRSMFDDVDRLFDENDDDSDNDDDDDNDDENDVETDFDILDAGRKFFADVLGYTELNEREGRTKMLTYVQLYAPHLNKIMHQGMLPNLSILLANMGYLGEKSHFEHTSYDPAYVALGNMFKKLLEMPMKGRSANEPVRDMCKEHGMVMECLIRIIYCSMGGFYDYANVIANFPIRHELYRRFVMFRMSPDEFANWLDQFDVWDPVRKKMIKETLNSLLHKIMKEYVHFMIRSMPGLKYFLHARFRFPEIDQDIRNCMDAVRQTRNYIYMGRGMADRVIFRRYEEFVFRRTKTNSTVKDGKNSKGPVDTRKSGWSGALSCIRAISKNTDKNRIEAMEEQWLDHGSERVKKRKKVEKTKETKTADDTVDIEFDKRGDSDPALYLDHTCFPNNGERETVAAQWLRMESRFDKYLAPEVLKLVSSRLLGELNVRMAKDLDDRRKSIEKHDILINKPVDVEKWDKCNDDRGEKDLRPRYWSLHALQLVGTQDGDESKKCDCPSCKEKNLSADEAYENYQMLLCTGKIGAITFDPVISKLCEDTSYWLGHVSVLNNQYRSIGIGIAHWVTIVCESINASKTNDKEFNAIAQEITEDELACLSMLACKHRDKPEDGLHTFLHPPLCCNETAIISFSMAVNQFVTASYTTDVRQILTEVLAEVHIRVYHMIRYYFYIILLKQATRVYDLPFDITLKQIRAFRRRYGVKETEDLPPDVDLCYYCCTHGLFKAETTASSSRAVMAKGPTNVSIDPMTGEPFCKRQDNKITKAIMKCYNMQHKRKRREKQFRNMEREIMNKLKSHVWSSDLNAEDSTKPSEMEDMDYEDENDSDDETPGVLDMLDSSMNTLLKNDDEFGDSDLKPGKRIPGGMIPEKDEASIAKTQVKRKTRAEADFKLTRICAREPLSKVHMIGKVIFSYNKCFMLCPLCTTPMVIQRNKFTEFGICCGVCTRQMRQDIPRNISNFFGFYCLVCGKNHIYGMSDVFRYEVMDDTVPPHVRLRYIYLCKFHNKPHIGEIPCISTMNNVVLYVNGHFYLKLVDGEYQLVQSQNAMNNMDETKRRKKKTRDCRHMAMNAIIPDDWIQFPE